MICKQCKIQNHFGCPGGCDCQHRSIPRPYDEVIRNGGEDSPMSVGDDNGDGGAGVGAGDLSMSGLPDNDGDGVGTD